MPWGSIVRRCCCMGCDFRVLEKLLTRKNTSHIERKENPFDVFCLSLCETREKKTSHL
ncbi:hypothetical protein Fmac_012639 [Flemingia macrophylla]|uniref:Uncharacterized protein n=1 Tax=Flemingia macrophylla TaxID=520843 RepID=A0ABD1MRR9_9FABA